MENGLNGNKRRLRKFFKIQNSKISKLIINGMAFCVLLTWLWIWPCIFAVSIYEAFSWNGIPWILFSGGEQKCSNASFSKFPQALSELNLTVYFLFDFSGIASLSGSSMRIFWNPSISMIWMKSRKSNSEVIFWNSWILNISYLAPSHGNSRSLKI